VVDTTVEFVFDTTVSFKNVTVDDVELVVVVVVVVVGGGD
jgi:hypothetical protein